MFKCLPSAFMLTSLYPAIITFSSSYVLLNGFFDLRLSNLLLYALGPSVFFLQVKMKIRSSLDGQNPMDKVCAFNFYLSLFPSFSPGLPSDPFCRFAVLLVPFPLLVSVFPCSGLLGAGCVVLLAIGGGPAASFIEERGVFLVAPQ